ncbi:MULTISPECIES: anti-sigma factor [Neomoorella]|uniref:Anti-sigma-W factor RsiW n=1 Tax=Neomoorella thermoacetica TaxID=1525 RepID=A0A1J5JFN9_NEOTH|nr:MULTISPECIES: zf-HC2 domain-containing protein [Moorella]OIQ07644.1 hypothetical protein MOOR_27420 [Moorella thermoacetica]OIQ10408.1 hypothetical protein MOOTH_26890 [Moorella thermoacetica]BCV22536.1 hypothetical protein hamaS1_26050 [Moorella sp. Hama-1]
MAKGCVYWQEIIPDYLAGELGQEEAHALREHLDCCPACRRELARWQKTFALLDLPPEDPGPDFTARVLAALEKDEAMPPVPVTRPGEQQAARPSLLSGNPPRQPVSLLAGLVLGFCLALGGWLLAGGRLPGLTRGISTFISVTVPFIQDAITGLVAFCQWQLAGLIQLLAGVVDAVGEKVFLLWVLGDTLVTLLQSVPPATWAALLAPGLAAGLLLERMLKPRTYQ